MSRPGEPSPTKGRKYEREHYEADEIRALLARTSSRSPSAVRNYALIMTLWQTGIRINEALELHPSDVDFTAREIFVRHAKGGAQFGGPRFRRVLCGQEALDAIARWLAIRDQRDLPRDAPLFCTLAGRKLYSTYVRSTLQRLARGAGWTKRVHPHGFRHTFAVTAAKAGVPVDVLRRQLGHTSLNTTQIYLSSLTMDDVREAMDRVTW